MVKDKDNNDKNIEDGLLPWDESKTEFKLEDRLVELYQSLRLGQQSLGQWQQGEMAVSAVPGAGKSHSLAVAAALTIARNQLNPQKQLVIVTYTRAAAANIKAKIKERLKYLGLPQWGFVVHTLHGLAFNIASRHPELSKLNLDTATLIIPTPSHRLIRGCVEKWINLNSPRYNLLLEGVKFDGEETEKLRRQSVLRTEVLPNLAYTVIGEAKSSGLLPGDLWQLSEKSRDEYKILAIAAGLYQQYEQLRREQNLIDYDDLILGALRVLETAKIRSYWQNQVFAVFEDEAQDSSPLQEHLISLLARDYNNPDLPPNLVRVGDPNQAINSTFTPADPIYFKWFGNKCQTQGNLATMDQAGRSSQIIIDGANFLVDWVNSLWVKSPEKSLAKSDLPFYPQHIQAVDIADPQPEANPQPVGKGLEIYTPEDIYQSVDLIAQRVIKLFAENPHHNAAILVRENRQGSFLGEQLAYLQRKHKIRVYEAGAKELNSKIPLEILKLLQFLQRPHSSNFLKGALEVLQGRELIAAQDLNVLAVSPEEFLYPTVLTPPAKPMVEQASRYCRNLLQARLELPHYQLMPFLGLTLKYSNSELASLQKLGEIIYREIRGKSSLATTIEVLLDSGMLNNFEGVEEDSEDKYIRPKQLTIITMHKAKGLDWDYVFIPFLHEDTLPGKPWVPNSSKFLGDFSLAEVARAQLRVAVHSKYQHSRVEIPQPLSAWEEAARLKKAEEYRLLYVAMTRAKRLLWMSAEVHGPFRWNVFQGGQGNQHSKLQAKQPGLALSALINNFPQCRCFSNNQLKT